jgi:uncharacterized DUF497 family protein
MNQESGFEWDDANRNHLWLHGVLPEEAEQAILDPDGMLLEIQTGVGEERLKALGMTAVGRLLAVVFTLRGAVIRPITAYTAPRRLQEVYFGGRDA